MSSIFWGFFLVFVNFNLTLNGHVLNLLPPFAGYLLVMKGCRELEEESGLFASIRPFALGMAVYTGILWLGDLLAVTGQGSWLTVLLGLAALAVSLYVSWAVAGHPGYGGPPGGGSEQRLPENRLDGAGCGPGCLLDPGDPGLPAGADRRDRGPGGHRLVSGRPLAQPEAL